MDYEHCHWQRNDPAIISGHRFVYCGGLYRVLLESDIFVTITRTALCTVVYCPAPTSPEWHHCAVCGSNVIHHHHIEPRGAGGSKSRKMNKLGVAPLCPKHHEEVTLHKWEDEIEHTPIGAFYIVRRGPKREDVKAYKIEDHPGAVLSDGGDIRVSQPLPVAQAGLPETPLPPSPSVAHPSAGAGGSFSLSGPPAYNEDGGASRRHQADAAMTLAIIPPYVEHDYGIEFAGEMTHAEFSGLIDKLRHEKSSRQWKVGDTWNEADLLGDWTYQYLEDFGYGYAEARHFARVAAAYTLQERAERPLKWTLFQSVYKHPERLDLLSRAVQEGWNRDQLREAAGHQKSQPAKKWGIVELREKAAEWPRFEGVGMVHDWLDWLEAEQ